MKKKLCFVLAFVLLFSSFPVVCFSGNKCDCGNVPVIMVSGFGATTLIKTNANGSEEVAFPFSKKTIKTAIKENVGKFNPDTPFLFLGEIAAQIVDPIRMNPDGTSYYDIKPVYSDAADTSLASFKANNALQYIPYTGSVFLDMECIGEIIGDDHVFNFLYDWRLSSDETADKLYDYVLSVLELTGHSRVSIYSLSQGSICVAQFLYKYADRKLVDNVVFNNPIMEGTDFVSDVFLGAKNGYDFDFYGILSLVSNILHTEKDFDDIAGLIPDGANFVAEFGAENYILPVVECGPAYLEMIPEDKFGEICGMYEFSDELLKKVDKVRKGYMADIEGTLRRAEKNSATVSVVSCSGLDLVTGTKKLSDSIVNVSMSCGAICSEKPFEKNYVQKNNIGKNCISPDRKIDLSAAYLPERTWIINELYHGQVEVAPVSLNLLKKLLLTHEIKDAWTSYDFPQFLQSDDPGSDFCLGFADTNCLSGVTGSNGTLVLTNTSHKNTMLIERIESTGAEITDKPDLPVLLKAGKSIVFEIETPENTSGSIRVSYYEKTGVLKSKVFNYSVTDDFSGAVDRNAGAGNIQEFSFFDRLSAAFSHKVNELSENISQLIFHSEKPDEKDL